MLKYGNNYIHPSDELDSLEKKAAEVYDKGGELPSSKHFVQNSGGKRQYKPRKNKRKHKNPVTVNSVNYGNESYYNSSVSFHKVDRIILGDGSESSEADIDY